jgi:hypothetical protein
LVKRLLAELDWVYRVDVIKSNHTYYRE